MANKWIEHLKAYAKKHKISYCEAVSSEECRKEYHKNKEKETSKSGKVKKQQIEFVMEPKKKVKKDDMAVKKNKKPVMD